MVLQTLPAVVLIVAMLACSSFRHLSTRRSVPMVVMHAKELLIPCSDGIQLAAKHWLPSQEVGNNTTSRILLLHGWLDNAASFNLLAPQLNFKMNAEVLAVDFPGHGLSGHKSLDGPTQLISEYAYYVSESLNFLNWHGDDDSTDTMNTDITVIGHSMGAAVALIHAAAFPEQCSSLVLLEGAGPLARNSDDISRHIRSSITRRLKSNKTLYPKDSGTNKGSRYSKPKNGNGRKRIYKNLDAAIAARKKTAQLVPGNQYISTEAAAAVVKRAAISSEDLSSLDVSKAGGKELSDECEGPVVFRHDARLTWPSLAYFSKDQVKALYRDVQCPSCLILADDGWPEDEWSGDAVKNILQPTRNIKLPGSHHFHADPDTSDAVIMSIINFLTKKE